MKVLTCSRHFHKGHPRQGEETWFVEKILSAILPRPLSVGLSEFPVAARDYINDFMVIEGSSKKHHTIRAGFRFKPGEMVSLRVWSDKPYRSKQVEFAQVEVKKVWNIEIKIINQAIGIKINGEDMKGTAGPRIAKNDGLEWIDFVNWFNVHPKKKSQVFTGQIICWSDTIEYTPSTLTEKMEA